MSDKIKVKHISKGPVVCEGDRHVFSRMTVYGSKPVIGFGPCWCDTERGHGQASRWVEFPCAPERPMSADERVRADKFMAAMVRVHSECGGADFVQTLFTALDQYRAEASHV